MEDLGIIFRGQLHKFTLISETPRHYVPGDRNIRQKISILADGIATYTSYSFSPEYGPVESGSRIFKISAEATAELFSMLEAYFCEEHLSLSFLEGGQWEITLEGESSESVHFASSYFQGQDRQLSVISQTLRQTLQIHGLYAFDGLYNLLETVTMLMDWKGSAVDAQISHEEIILERASGTIRINQDLGQVGEAFQEYHIPEKVRDLLNDLSLSIISSHPEHRSNIPPNMQSYQLRLCFSDGPPVCFTGIFNKLDSPSVVRNFLYHLQKLLQPLIPTVLNREIYAQSILRPGQKILCDVRFNELENFPCYYLAQDDSVQEGDNVTVCIGTQHLEVLGTVFRKLYVAPEDMIFSLEKLSSIQNTDFYEFGYDVLGPYSLVDIKIVLQAMPCLSEELLRLYSYCSNRAEWLAAEQETCCLPDSVTAEYSEWINLKEQMEVIMRGSNTAYPSVSSSVLSVLLQNGYQFLKGFWIEPEAAD